MRAHSKRSKVMHKEFTMTIIDELMDHAEKYSDKETSEIFYSPAASSLAQDIETPDYKSKLRRKTEAGENSTAEETLQSLMIKKRKE